MDDAVEEHKDLQEKQELLFWAAARGLLGDAQELVTQGALPGGADKHGRTPAHYAAAHGHVPILEFLSKVGADMDAEDGKGRGPLHYAALGDHVRAVQFLCSKGVWVDAPDGADDTPLHLAARGLAHTVAELRPSSLAAPPTPVKHAGKAAAELLRAGAKSALRNARGLTPLAEAVAANNAGAVVALLDAHALTTITVKGFSLLHLAAGLGHTEILERLLVDGRGLTLDPADNPAHATPLHAAAQHGRAAAARLLLDRGAADASIPDGNGQLPKDALAAVLAGMAPDQTASFGSTRNELAALLRTLEARAGTKGAARKQAAAAPPPKPSPPPASPPPAAAADASPAEQFASLPVEEQRRKVLAWSKLRDDELQGMAFPPAAARPALQALHRAVSVHECWAAVAAIRQDQAFQEDAADPHVKEAVADLQRPNADPKQYAGDRTVQAVFGKMNKLSGILRQGGQGFKVSLDDLIAQRTGPSSVTETLRQLRNLESRLEAARDAAIAAVLGKPPPSPQDRQVSTEKDEEQEAVQQQGQGKGGGAPLPSIAEGQENPPTLLERLRGVMVVLGWQALRAVVMFSAMMAVMWVMGMLPDQIRAKQEEFALHAERLRQARQVAGVEGAGRVVADLLDGLREGDVRPTLHQEL